MTRIIELEYAASATEQMANHIREAHHRALVGTAMKTVTYIKASLIPSLMPHPPVDRHHYTAQWNYEDLGSMSGVAIYNNSALPNVPASVVEYGVPGARVKAGIKMRAAIEQWVVRKGICTADDAKAVTWRIVGKMKSQGIMNKGKGWTIIKRVLPYIRKTFSELIAVEMEQVRL